MSIPTWREYEEKCGHPVTEGEYQFYLKTNYKYKLEQDNYYTNEHGILIDKRGE